MISREEPLWCDDEQRNAVLAAVAHPLNGLDYVEYRRDLLAPPGQRHRIELTFLKPFPAVLVGDPAALRIEGGVRVVGITVTGTAATPDPLRLVAFADREGDFSTYWLHVAHPQIDPERSEAAFSFKAGCPSEFDCRPGHDCPPDTPIEPALDYLAKDYQSFRRLMMDLAPQLNPDFIERNPADLSVTLIELFAYVGDFLSYRQDWATTEAFFATCRDRISAARHARLIDYAMHQGRNAHGFVQFDGAAGVNGIVLAGTRLLTRVNAPLRGAAMPPGLVIPAGAADFDGDPPLESAIVFETAAPVRVIAARNAMRVHDWGDAQCCLARGAREAWLYAVRRQGADLIAEAPPFEAGEYLLLEEVLGPTTGNAADADPRQRAVVRIEAVEAATDRAFSNRLVGGVLTPATPMGAVLPLTRVRWRETDALPRTFCLSSVDRLSGSAIPGVTVARGNVTTADHGCTRVREYPDAVAPEPVLPAIDRGTGRWPIDLQRIIEAPLTFQTMATQAMGGDAAYAPDGRLAAGRHDLDQPASAALPAITITYSWDGGETELFQPVASLIGSGTYDAHFVAETGDSGVQLRFGDDQYGRRVGEPIAARARYRIGNGRAGNIGRDALVHILTPDAADLVDPANPAGPALPFPAIVALRQPLPMRGGTEPETIDEVRALAPAAFRAETLRAVTEEDYAAAARKLSGVVAAKARFRWTGSWHTVFVAIHPANPGSLVRMAGGGAALAPAFAARALAWIGRYRLAGYDLVVRAANYVPVEIDVRLCIAPGHFRGEVMAAAAAALSTRAGAVFDPAGFDFGEPLYLSRIYAALQTIDGVESALVTRFKRFRDVANGEMERGAISVGADEIIRCDDDPNLPENGVLRLSAVGGL